MDWFSWLSKTGLDSSLVYKYALTFTNNELESDDLAYFNHEFLQSMGISIAKHRLEILKLARKEGGRRTYPILWFVVAVKKTKNYLANHIQAMVHRETAARSIVPKRNQSLRWKVAMLQRNKIFRGSKPEWPMLRNNIHAVKSDHKMLMLMDGSPMDSQNSSSVEPKVNVEAKSPSSVEPKVNVESCHIARDMLANPLNNSFSSAMVHSLDFENWSSGMEEINWDSMFQNLKPT